MIMVKGKTTRKNKCGLFNEETGVLSSDFFDFLVEWEIKRSLRYQNFATLLILEPDRKPQSPETLGRLGTLIRKNVRETDLIGRIGKARFGILLLKTDLDGAYIITSRIMDHISNYIFSQEEVQQLTLSIGGACFPINSTSIERSDLFKEAEDALKVAKKKGNSVYLPGVPVLRTAGGE
jgi:diguanylate cyclase (GGDEF)-like protein